MHCPPPADTGQMTTRKRLYIDCTGTYLHGLNTGIQRVVRNLIKHSAAAGRDHAAEIIPIVSIHGRYFAVAGLDDPAGRKRIRSILERGIMRRAHKHRRPLATASAAEAYQRHLSGRDYAISAVAPPAIGLAERIATRILAMSHPPEVVFEAGDILFLPDVGWAEENWFLHCAARAKGVLFIPFIYDVIPLTHRDIYGSHTTGNFEAWLIKMALLADGMACISQYARRTLIEQLVRLRLLVDEDRIRVGLLGHDFCPAEATRVTHTGLQQAMAAGVPIFLCVGTIEPRKNLFTLLEGFDHYLAAGGAGQLILIGRKGWLCDDFLTALTGHREYDRRLHWFDDVDDANLEWAYGHASAVIFPSIVEGFGLPIVEALGRGTPVIASDIEVFREIAGDHVMFFPPLDARALADRMRQIEAEGTAASRARAANFKWLNWQQSARGIFGEVIQLAEQAHQRGPR